MHARHEIAFIDRTVFDLASLVSGLRPEVEAVVLDGARPVPVQMAQALAGRRGLAAIHVIAHGAPGEIRFEAGTLSGENLYVHVADLALLGAALDEGGELLLWSCNSAQGSRGRAFVEALSDLTGADVRAADGLIGSPQLGGSWQLESGSTAMHRAPLSAAAIATYAGVMDMGTTLYVDGTSEPGHFATIQAAINAADDGDTIIIAEGAYTEQLLISGKSNLIIQAAEDAEITVGMPGSPVFNALAAEANGKDRAAVVTIKDSTNITLHGFTVDGNGLANAMPSSGAPNPDFEGVLVLDSSATLDGLTIAEVRDPLNLDGTPSGNQRGNAILVLNTDGEERSVTISDNHLSDFQKNGITVSGAGLSATISGNDVEGAGFLPAANAIAQNGIQVSSGAAATITNNTISEIGYQRGDYVTSGILAYGAADGIAISGNTFHGATLGGAAQPTTHIGIYVIGETDNAVITGNAMNHLTLGIILADDTDSPTVSGNTFTNMFASVTTNTGTLATWTGDNYEIYGADNDSPLNFVGSSGVDYVEGTNFGDVIDGAGGDDILNGGGGADTLLGGEGNDDIDGAAGTDTAVFAGDLDDYDLSGLIVSGGVISGTITGPDGIDTLSGIETLKIGGAIVVLPGQSIQAAIDAAEAGDTIMVTAGTYNENLTITKSLTLLGAQAGVDATGTARVGGETVINGYIGNNNPYAGILVKADGVTVDGFAITNFFRDGITVQNSDVATSPGESLRHDITIANNWIYKGDVGTGTSNGLLFGENYTNNANSTLDATLDNLVLDGNYIDVGTPNARPIAFSSQFRGTGGSFVVSDMVVNDNTVTASSAGVSINFAQYGAQTFTNAMITDNDFLGRVSLSGVSGSIITGNDFGQSTYLGIASSTISSNEFNAGATYSYALYFEGSGNGNPTPSSNLTLSDNNFTYNDEAIAPSAGYVAGIAYDIGADVATIVVDVTNTFKDVGAITGLPTLEQAGRATGTTGADTLVGTTLPDVLKGSDGDDALTGGGGGDYLQGGSGTDTASYTDAVTPAMITAVADADPFTVGDQPGWQVATSGGEGSDLLTGIEVVDGVEPGEILLVGNGGYATIQAAINAAAAGDTILIANGTYTENVTINKAGLTLQSASGNAADVVIQGTFRSGNSIPDGTTVGDWLETAASYTGASGAGITVSANGITIKKLTVTSFATGIELGSNNGLSLDGVTLDECVSGVRKGTAAVVTDFTMTGGSITDSYHGMAIYAATAAGAFDDVTIDGTSFAHLTEKGIYAEQLSNAIITNITMNDVGEFGRGPAFGAAGKGEYGNGIDINLKHGTYANIEISNFIFTDVGSSSEPDMVPLDLGAAIAIKARDDGSYASVPASASNITVHDGTINGTSTGIRIGEPGQSNAGPAVTVSDVTISGADVALYDNVTLSLLSVTNADDSVTLVGGSGNDMLAGTAEDDTLVGSGGKDTAVLSGDYGDATISISDGHVVVMTADGGTDTLTGVEKLQFADQAVWLVDPAGVNGAISLSAVVASASTSDVLLLLDGTHNLGTSTLNIDKTLTIIGQSEDGTVIDASGIDGYGMLVTADGTSLSNFTLNGPAAAPLGGNYGIKVQPDTGDPSDRLDGLTIDHVTVQNSGRSEFDLNGVMNATLSNVTADGMDTDGVGIALTDTLNVTLENVTTTGNLWGSIGLYPTNIYYDQPMSGVTFTGTFTHDEPIGIYIDDISAVNDLTGLILPADYVGTGWQVTNDAYRGAESTHFTLIYATEEDAEAMALSIQGPPSVVNTRSVITAPDGTIVVKEGMSLQAAIDAAEAGDTIMIAAGTYTENVTVDKDVTIFGANAGIASDGERGAESILNGGFQITADGVTIDGMEIVGGRLDYGSQRSGVFINGAQSDVTIANNIIDAGSSAEADLRGILSTYGANTVNLQVTGNAVTGWASGMYLNPGVSASAILGNSFDDNGNHINVDDPDSLTIAGNTFGASVGAKIGVGAMDATVDVEAALGLSGNAFTDGTPPLSIYPYGSAGQQILGTSGDDRFRGDYGWPDVGRTYEGRGGADFIAGGSGIDTARYSGTLTAADITTATDVNAYADGDQAGWSIASATDGTDGLIGVERVTDGNGNTYLLVGSGGFADGTAAAAAAKDGDVILFANGSGNSIDLSGSTENENIEIGGSSNDTVVTGSGDDTVHAGDGNDVVKTGAGNDTIIGGQGGGDDIYDGGIGDDTVTYPSANAGVTIDLRAADRSATALSGADGAGGPNPDTVGDLLSANGYSPTLAVGLATGDDIGTDVLISIENATGGSGDDTFIGNAGANVFDGAGGSDTVDYSAIDSGIGLNVTIDSDDGAGYSALTTAGGSDTLIRIENIVGTQRPDFISGDEFANILQGNGGNDVLDGGDGVDEARFVGTAVDNLANTFDAATLQVNAGTLGQGTDTLANFETIRFSGSDSVFDEDDQVFTINGTNGNVITLTAKDGGDATEKGGTLNGAGGQNATGNVLTNDIDLDDAHGDLVVTAISGGGTVGTEFATTYGFLTLGADGGYTYRINEDNATVQALNTGSIPLTETFTYTVSDGEDTATATLTIAVHGANDFAVITGETTGDRDVTEENELSASGTLTIADVDAGESFFVPASATTSYGSYTLDENGAWTYALDNGDPTVQALSAIETLTDTFTAVSQDGTASQVVTITIAGTNDVPVISGVAVDDVTEDATTPDLTAGGALTIVDTDAGESTFAVQAGTAGSNGYGTFTLDAAGNWTYTADGTQTAIQELGAGQSLTDTFTAVSSDGTASQLVTVTIHGTNDVPVIGGDATGDVTEDATTPTLTTGGALTVTDADAGQSIFAVQAGTVGSYGTFTLEAAGNWTYTADGTQAAIQQLGAEETLTDTFTAVSQDGTASQLVTVTITGANDGPTLGFAQGFETSSDGIFDGGDYGEVTVVDESTTALQTPDGSHYAILTETDSGPFTRFDGYRTAFVDGLTSGVKVYLDTSWGDDQGFEYSVAANGSDGAHQRDYIFHVVSTGTGVLHVGGNNNADGNSNAPVANSITIAQSGWYTLQHVFHDVGGVLSVDLNLVDEDGTVIHVATLSSPADTIPAEVGGNRYGWFTSIDVPGGIAVDTFTLGSFSGAVAEVVDGAPDETSHEYTAKGVVPFLDVDLSDAHTVSVTSPEGGFGTLEAVVAPDGTVDGQGAVSWTFAVDNAAIDHLADGQVVTQTYTLTLSDGEGGTATQDVTITITGTNDAPVVSGAVEGAATEDGGTSTLDALLNASDVDNATLLVVDVPNELPPGVTYNPATNSFTLDPTDPAFDSLAPGATATVTVDYGVSDGITTTPASVSWTVTGTNDGPVVTGTLNADASEDGSIVTIDALANASDVDAGTTLVVVPPASLPAGVSFVGDTQAIDFEDYALGSVVGQQGWTDGSPSSPANAIVDLEDDHGNVLRLANDPSSGDFAGPYSPVLSVTAGESGSGADVDRVVLTFQFKPVQGVADGSRIEIDLATGSDRNNFMALEYTGDPAVGLRLAINSPQADGHWTNDSFDFATGNVTLASNIDPTQWHTVQVVADFNEGSDDDTVSYYLDGHLVGTGSTFENYQEFIVGKLHEAAVAGTAVGQILFRAGEAPNNPFLQDGAGGNRQGFYIDNVGLQTYSGEASFQIDPSDPAYQHLAQGQTQVVTVDYGVSDGTETTPASLTFTVTGTNDAPVVSGAVEGTATEDGGSATLNALLNASDVDDGTTLLVELPPTLPAGVTYDEETHSFTLDPTNAAYQSLAEDDETVVSVTYGVSDGITTTQATVSWTVTGTNDDPVISESSQVTGEAVEAGSLDNVVQAGTNPAVANGFEPTVDLDSTIGPWLALHPTEVATLLVTVLANLPAGATMADAIAQVWDFLDDTYVAGGNYYDVEANLPFVYLGIEYAKYLNADGKPLTDVLVKYSPDGALYPPNGVPDRFQSMHDNLLGNLNGGALTDRFGTASQERIDIDAAMAAAFISDLQNRPYYDGNEPHSAAAVRTFDVTNGYLPAASGQMVADDVDSDAALTWSGDADGDYGTFAITAGGAWTYTLDNSRPATQALKEGQSVTDTFTVMVSDTHGGTDTETVTITIHGANDAPVVTSSVQAGSVEEDATLTATGTVTSEDVDADATASYTGDAIGTYGSFEVDAVTGAWTYTLDNAAHQALVADEVHTETFTVTVTDDKGATATQDIVVTITGTNDVPVITSSAQAGSVKEDETLTATGQVKSSDADAGATATYSGNATGTYGSFEVDAVTGAWTYTLDNAAHQALKAGDTFIETFPVTVTDDEGTTATQDVVITITGTNDGPTVTGALSATADEGDLALALDLLSGASDLDAGETVTLTVTNVTYAIDGGTASATAPAGVSLAGSTLTVDLTDAAFDHLAEGDSTMIVVSYEVQDAQGAVVPQTQTITVTGTNDAPIATANTNAGNPVVEGGVFPGNTAFAGDPSAAGNVLADDSDLDDGASLSVSAIRAGTDGMDTTVPSGGADAVVAGKYGSLTIHADGSYSYALDNGEAATNALALGETGHDVFTYTITDEHDATTSATLTIDITGTNDVPVATIDDNSSDAVSESGVHPGNTPFAGDLTATGSVLLNDTDVDAGDLLSVYSVQGLTANVGHAVAGIYGSLVVDQYGHYTYTLGDDNPATQALAQDESVQDFFIYSVTDSHGARSTSFLTINITGTNDAPVITADVGEVTEDITAVPIGGNVLGNDADPDAGGTQTVTAVDGSAGNVGIDVSGIYGILHLNSDGSYTYTLDNARAAVQAIADGDEVADVFTYTNTDNNGASTTGTLTITVIGTNDGPVASTPIVSTVSEDAPAYTIDLRTNVTDIDQGAVLQVVGLVGLTAGLSLDADGHTLHVDPNAFTSLAAGESEVIQLTYSVVDELGESVEHSATITITGTND
ncbi:VCBS domain-containing protein, partial [Xanthobacteraceae bacterium Astr-EGSB]|uniref:VCBS domain-containing protein n=1 Tax=Astrobacterium formosum TaxID=3069710 RepID=UPI0027B157B3|nr:VCBS domain-containing protein [Xanthobacteraceae bacterium Astr-EGSB]